MSNYSKLAKHPVTGKFEMADFLDNFYGKNEYAVKFKDGYTLRAEKVQSIEPKFVKQKY